MTTPNPYPESPVPGSGWSRAMADEEVERFVEDLLETWNSHDLERLEAFYAPEYEGVNIGRTAPYRGPRDASRNLADYLEAFPDLCFERDEVVVQDNRVAVFWTLRGTHAGKLMRIPPTGRRVEVRGVSLFTMEGGMITRGLHIWDVAGLLREIGLLPEL